jgi:hypothetical protein
MKNYRNGKVKRNYDDDCFSGYVFTETCLLFYYYIASVRALTHTMGIFKVKTQHVDVINADLIEVELYSSHSGVLEKCPHLHCNRFRAIYHKKSPEFIYQNHSYNSNY